MSNAGFQTFTQLFQRLDQTTSSKKKIEHLVEYFKNAPDPDKVWAIAIMSGKRPSRAVNTTLLRTWAAEMSQLPLWLFEESYHIVGDLAETIALVLPESTQQSSFDLTYWIQQMIDVKSADEEEKKNFIFNSWNQLQPFERFVFNKLITGGFRVGVAKKTITKALSIVADKEEAHIAHRLIGQWNPNETTFAELIFEDNILDDLSKPFPFLLAHPVEGETNALGDIQNYQFEHKWDGIRGQLIHRKGHLFVWSRGEELVTDKYPEYLEMQPHLPEGIALDGEIIGFQNERPLPFQQLQKRINRKSIGKKLRQEIPIVFIAYDIMEYQGNDVRHLPLLKRRQLLEEVVKETRHPHLLLSNVLGFHSWSEAASEREKSRSIGSEGLMIKKLDATYQHGRKRGIWWKWKVDPLTIDAVMIYAMRGHGRRSGLYTDLTFAVWDGDLLVPFAKAYSGLTDAEFKEVTAFVNKNTKERFGPVRSVRPELVFELAFEGIGASTRHKSGIAVRFPRILRWRHDKKPEDANTLSELKALINS